MLFGGQGVEGKNVLSERDSGDTDGPPNPDGWTSWTLYASPTPARWTMTSSGESAGDGDAAAEGLAAPEGDGEIAAVDDEPHAASIVAARTAITARMLS